MTLGDGWRYLYQELSRWGGWGPGLPWRNGGLRTVVVESERMAFPDGLNQGYLLSRNEGPMIATLPTKTLWVGLLMVATGTLALCQEENVNPDVPSTSQSSRKSELIPLRIRKVERVDRMGPLSAEGTSLEAAVPEEEVAWESERLSEKILQDLKKLVRGQGETGNDDRGSVSGLGSTACRVGANGSDVLGMATLAEQGRGDASQSKRSLWKLSRNRISRVCT